MEQLTLHHYGILTHDTAAWLAENELLFGKPTKVFDTVKISSQKVNITFVQQLAANVLTELVEPWDDNKDMQRMIAKGVTVYHAGYLAAEGKFDEIVLSLQGKGMHALKSFRSEAFENKRCVFIISGTSGLIEIIEQ